MLTSLALNFAPNPFAALEIVFWLMGSLADRSFEHVWLALPFMAVGWLLLFTLGRPLDALTLGEDTAGTLGFDLVRVRHAIAAETRGESGLISTSRTDNRNYVLSIKSMHERPPLVGVEIPGEWKE